MKNRANIIFLFMMLCLQVAGQKVPGLCGNASASVCKGFVLRYNSFNEFEMNGSEAIYLDTCVTVINNKNDLAVHDGCRGLTYHYTRMDGYWKNNIEYQYPENSLNKYKAKAPIISKRLARYLTSDSIFELIQTIFQDQLFSTCISVKTPEYSLFISNVSNDVGVDTLLFIRDILSKTSEDMIEKNYKFSADQQTIYYGWNAGLSAIRFPTGHAEGVWPGVNVQFKVSDGAIRDDGTYTSADIMPCYPLGERGLIEDLGIDEFLDVGDTMGEKVYLSLLISTSGKILDVNPIRISDSEKVRMEIRKRATSLLSFSIGNIKGDPVNVWYTLCMCFDEKNRKWIPSSYS